MAGFNKELAQKSVPAGVKRRNFVGANQHCDFHAAYTRKDISFFPSDICAARNRTSSQCCDGRLTFRKTEPCFEQFLCSLIV